METGSLWAEHLAPISFQSTEIMHCIKGRVHSREQGGAVTVRAVVRGAVPAAVAKQGLESVSRIPSLTELGKWVWASHPERESPLNEPGTSGILWGMYYQWNEHIFLGLAESIPLTSHHGVCVICLLSFDDCWSFWHETSIRCQWTIVLKSYFQVFNFSLYLCFSL